MPWKDGYTITDEKGMHDEIIKWPQKQRCVATIVVDYNVQADQDGIDINDIQRQVCEYGRKVEIWNLLDIFDKYEMRATFATPAIIAENYKESMREIVHRGHEVAAHGYKREDVSLLEKAEEKRRLDLTTSTIEKISGQRPVGWFCMPRQKDPFAGGTISPDTAELLVDAGYEYLGNGMADDIPHYWVTNFKTRQNILTLPYHYQFDDQFFLMFPPLGMGCGLENSKTLFQNWKLEFDATYKRGRYFSIFIHPYLIQWGNRLEVLENILAYIKDFNDVWNPTCREVTQYWKDTYPANSFLKLKESIWKDYPGSLS